jgi:hypothetical protein
VTDDDRHVVLVNELVFLQYAMDQLEEAAGYVTDEKLLTRMDAASSYLKSLYEALYGAHLEKYPGQEPPEPE